MCIRAVCRKIDVRGCAGPLQGVVMITTVNVASSSRDAVRKGGERVTDRSFGSVTAGVLTLLVSFTFQPIVPRIEAGRNTGVESAGAGVERPSLSVAGPLADARRGGGLGQRRPRPLLVHGGLLSHLADLWTAKMKSRGMTRGTM